MVSFLSSRICVSTQIMVLRANKVVINLSSICKDLMKEIGDMGEPANSGPGRIQLTILTSTGDWASIFREAGGPDRKPKEGNELPEKVSPGDSDE
jgi:hypothetical protein